MIHADDWVNPSEGYGELLLLAVQTTKLEPTALCPQEGGARCVRCLIVSSHRRSWTCLCSFREKCGVLIPQFLEEHINFR